ncbi:Hypothetical predicted protein [Podarcis lilfordi]|uniref:Uncharacterized protein n=1 Tax=Podarcis lilfordi TaxID=74358 RepID=A0AA35P2I9_9SAUR|nr:Hypothetical predicted protein [Podarcis lilfordi]
MSQLCPAAAAFGARKGEREEWRRSGALGAAAAVEAAAGGSGEESRRRPPDSPAGTERGRGLRAGNPLPRSTKTILNSSEMEVSGFPSVYRNSENSELKKLESGTCSLRLM